MQEEAFLTLHGSNLQHLMNSHLRGCLQAVSVHWQHISPRRRKHFCHAPRGTSALHLLKPSPSEQAPGSCWLPGPSTAQPGSQMAREDPGLTGGGLHLVLLKSGHRFGTE